VLLYLSLTLQTKILVFLTRIVLFYHFTNKTENISQ